MESLEKSITRLRKRIKDQGHLILLFQSRVTVMHTLRQSLKAARKRLRINNSLALFI